MSVFDCSCDQLAAFRAARRAIGSGELVVVPTDTLYGVAADAFAPAAVQKLLAAKNRQNIPPVLVGSLAAFEAITRSVPPAARRLAEKFWPGPLTIILPTRPGLLWGPSVAVRIPQQQFLLELLNETGPLAVSSANISGAAPALTIAEAQAMLGESVSVYLDNGPIDNADRTPSTIVDLRPLVAAEAGSPDASGESQDLAASAPRILRLGALSAAQLSAAAGVELTD